ncbi:DUF134 domain-containing protein [uncultured Ferrimonas sp.]|uniref:DUF134 domain-containing protein n=1 Tax=uncultured Ferrimonas sp. TaxID=432640 RepID=UPI0026326EBE|nr:DUF134 domain-containing protein [uncultured Ferrimonas sp.]
MSRPKIPRTVCGRPANSCFKPNGIPMPNLEQIPLSPDEFEALRLVDLHGLQQRQAAEQMGVSRQTLANIIKSARSKVVDCLANGKALMMETSEGKIDEHRDPDE